jgi:hypothetical protein
MFKNFIKPIVLSFFCFTFFVCEIAVASAKELMITVSNPSKTDRKAETIEILWQKLHKLKDINPKEIIVKDLETGKEIPSQVIYLGLETPQSIIFQTDLSQSETRKFIIEKGVPANYQSKVFGRQVPERFDDFAWENDKAAFRMYGEALESQKGMAKGIDFWAKRTPNLVINKWYKSEDYHNDNGEGVDAYHVGITLGAGNAEPFFNNEIIYPINYSSYKILDKGPIRISFQLIYKPFKVNGIEVQEVKTISLDAGSQLNKIVNQYVTTTDLTIAIGITKHKDDGIKKVDSDNNILAYWDQADGKTDNGKMGVGVFYPLNNVKEFKETKEHLLMLAPLDKNQKLVYYQGGGWSKSGNFNNPDSWINYLVQFKNNLDNRPKVTLKSKN